jgi:hypothetical protein
LTALLIGDQKRIPPELAAAYTRAGVNHILSVSGFHVGIIAYFIVMLALLLTTRSEKLALHFNLRRMVLILTVPAMLLYLCLTGSAPATARSVIMLAAFVLALCAERETDPVNGLLLSAHSFRYIISVILSGAVGDCRHSSAGHGLIKYYQAWLAANTDPVCGCVLCSLVCDCCAGALHI